MIDKLQKKYYYYYELFHRSCIFFISRSKRKHLWPCLYIIEETSKVIVVVAILCHSSQLLNWLLGILKHPEHLLLLLASEMLN